MNKNEQLWVLSACLISENAVTAVIDKMKLEDFTVPELRNIFNAINSLFSKNRKIDVSTLIDELQKLGLKYDESWIRAEFDFAISSDSLVGEHIKIVKEGTLKISLKKITAWINNEIAKGRDVVEIINEAREKFMNIDTTEDKHDFTPAEAVSKTLKHTQETIASGKPVGLRTYIPELDEYMIMKKGNLIGILADGGCGKTMLANQIAFSNVMNGKKVAFFNMEMEAEELMNREISRQSMIGLDDITWGKNIDIEKYSYHAEALMGETFHIDDNGEQTIPKIHSRLIRYRNEMKGLDLVVIDYFQLIEGGKGQTRQIELGSVSRALKKLTKHFQVPIIILAQTNEDGKTREAKDLQKDADIMMYLFRPAYDKHNTHFKDGVLKIMRDGQYVVPEDNYVVVKIGKHRGGETAKIRLSFDGKHQRFYSWEQDCVNI